MATIYVKKDGSGDALTIQQGIQLAQISDVVEIEAGVFDENIDLFKGITLKGSGINSTIITGAVRTAITARPFVFISGQFTLNLTQAAIDSGITTADYEIGRILTASGIPTNTRLVSKTPTSITLSAAVTSAATSRTVSMALQNDASMRVRGTNGVIKDLKVVGFDHPNPAAEYAAIYLRNTGLGSAAANNWEIFNCEFQANGEYSLLTDFAAGVGNLNIHDCKFSGKTFVGDNPATGNQYSVFNVPRQLVTIQGVNVNVTFQNNQITGITGGLTIDGVPSYNTAVTIDPVGAIVSGNTIDTDSGTTGYALRCRGLNAEVNNNTATGTSAGYYILPNHSVGVLISTGTMISNSSKYWICIQEHTSSATNAPTGAEGASYWSEITLEQVNASEEYGIGLAVIGSNGNVSEVLIIVSQESAGQPIKTTMSKSLVKAISKVAEDVVFSDESNWKLVSFIFKKDTSAQRLVSAFRDFDAEKTIKLKSGMASGDQFELHKIIISKPDRTLLVMKRNEIEDAESFDFVLK
jgi:hypothetical protein